MSQQHRDYKVSLTRHDLQLVLEIRRSRMTFSAACIFLVLGCTAAGAILIRESKEQQSMREVMRVRVESLNRRRTFLNMDPLQTRAYIPHTALAPIWIQAVIMLLGVILGIWGVLIALTFKDKMLRFLLGSTVVLLIACSTVAFRMFVFSPHLSPSHLVRNLESYTGIGDNDSTSVFWNSIMVHDQCCGVMSYHDFFRWGDWNYSKQTFSIGKYETKLEILKVEVSLTCCTDQAFHLAKKGNFTALDRCGKALDHEYITEQGCYEVGVKLIKSFWRQSKFWVLTAMAVAGMLLFITFGVMLHFVLVHAETLTVLTCSPRFFHGRSWDDFLAYPGISTAAMAGITTLLSSFKFSLTKHDIQLVLEMRRSRATFCAACIFLVLVCGASGGILIRESVEQHSMRGDMLARVESLNWRRTLLNLDPLQTRAYMTHTALVPIWILSAFMGVVIVLGTCGFIIGVTFKDKLLRVVLGTTTVMLIACSTVAFRMFVFSPHLQPSHLVRNLENYTGIGDDDGTYVFWNSIMVYDKCCGVMSYHDFFRWGDWNYSSQTYYVGENQTKVELFRVEVSLVCCTDNVFYMAKKGNFTGLAHCAKALDHDFITEQGCYEVGVKLIKSFWRQSKFFVLTALAVGGKLLFVISGVNLYFVLMRAEALAANSGTRNLQHKRSWDDFLSRPNIPTLPTDGVTDSYDSLALSAMEHRASQISALRRKETVHNSASMKELADEGATGDLDMI